MSDIKIEFNSDDVGYQLWEDMREAEKVLSDIRVKVQTAILNSPKMEFFKSMTHSVKYGSYSVAYGSYGIPSVSAPAMGVSTPYTPSPLANLSDKTINLLLNGPALTADQKSKLVKLVVPQLFDDPESAADK